MQEGTNWSCPAAHIRCNEPDQVMLYFCPSVLHGVARRFQEGFPGLVTYAVKANPGDEVLSNLVAAGIRAFDVASPAEMRAVRAVCPDAVLHYNNPIRSLDEIAVARSLGVQSYSMDCLRELEKLGDLPKDTEISVRLALPIAGAVYDFGSKFGVGPKKVSELLQQVARRGLRPSITFHPGTQCADPMAWRSYISVAADVARQADVRLHRLNVGGGFAAHRVGDAPDLEAIFDGIVDEVSQSFGANAPALVCEPGRAMVADAFTVAARVKARRDDEAVFLNDGIYGGLSEARDMIMVDRINVIGSDGLPRQGVTQRFIAFGPTCDSIDRLPESITLPACVDEGDYVLFHGMGAYSRSISTGFNGYGVGDPVTVARLG